MKHIKFKFLLLFILSGFSASSYAGNPTAYLNFASFSTPAGQNYLETYLSVVGSSLKFVKNANNKYVGKAHVTITFKMGDSVVTSANFNVVSPEITDTLIRPNFIDAHRFWLKKGNYTLLFTLDDPNDNSHKTVSGKQPVHTGYPSDTINISDAEFLASYTPSNNPSAYNKCGFDMIPYVFSDYPQSVKKLVFYCEIYNTAKFVPREKLTVKYAIEDDADYAVNLSPNNTNTISLSAERDADTIIPFMAQLPLDNLPTGNYFLVVSVADINNHILAKHKYSFTRENSGVKSTLIPAGFAPYMANRDTLEESIHCLAPISNGPEKDYVLSDSLKWVNITELKRFFYNFWVAHDSANPLEGWQKYLANVLKVKNSFSVRGIKGYKTDRGRVYLEYGAPNQRVVEKNNPETYPYEIWQYYRLTDGQTNVKFVFYAPAIETNNYELLHSTAIGEIKNSAWQTVLYSRNGTPADIDQKTIPDNIGEDVNDQYNNPH